MSFSIVTSVMGLFLAFGHGPSQEIGWNKPGVSEIEFQADLDACTAIFDERLALEEVQYGIRQHILGSMDTFQTEFKDETESIQDYAICFMTRGYQYTALTYIESDRLNRRTISPNRRALLLYQVATSERSDVDYDGVGE